jgi:predicted transcriptional regulator YdeE
MVMSQTVVILNKKNFVGVELRTSNEKGKAEIDIPKHWENFFKENIADQISNKSSEKVYALYTNYEGDHTQPYSLIIAFEVNQIPETLPDGLVSVQVPEASYLQYPVEGKFPESIIKKYQEVWSADIERTFSVDFEVYDENFDSKSGDSSGINLLIGVQP